MTHRFAVRFVALALALPISAMAQAGSTDLRTQLAKLDQAWQTAYNAGDAAAVAALYTEDAKVIPPGHAAVSGRAAIQAFFAEDIATAQGAKNALTTEEAFGGGDVAIAVGGWVATKADGTHADHGMYVTVYKQVDGGWKIYRDTWNSSMAH